jgi:hypothetical protein
MALAPTLQTATDGGADATAPEQSHAFLAIRSLADRAFPARMFATAASGRS